MSNLKAGGFLLLFSLVVGCRGQSEPAVAVATTSTYLECAVKDLLGDGTPVLRLAGPGMCPGHFDIRPSQVRALRRCRLLLRFDFQQSLDDKLADLRLSGLATGSVTPEGGLCEPATYVCACEQVGEALRASGLAGQIELSGRLQAVAARMESLSETLRAQVRQQGLVNRGVLCSKHQAAFCRWLGLNVLATFSGADAATTGQLNQAIEGGEAGGARLVIANRPEGRRVADALADRLGARVVVLDNFPEEGAAEGFDRLLRRNVEALLEVVPR
jgi:zinc transport system substrate-binding protein